ncbi:MAG: hypothetical protein ACOCQY_02930 [Halorhabdus sp.]
MMLSDREWLRFVTFGIVAGATAGALYTGALLVFGQSLVGAMVGAVVGCGVFAVLVHVTLRYLVNRALEPAAGNTTDSEADTEAHS